jgi:hypothetical protein
MAPRSILGAFLCVVVVGITLTGSALLAALKSVNLFTSIIAEMG